jgi:hypothetical protein
MTKPKPQAHLKESQLHEYLDGALSTASRAELESHLADCPACTRKLAELRSLFTSLEHLPEVQLQTDLVGSVLAKIEPAPGAALRWVLALEAAAALLLLAAFWPFVRLLAHRPLPQYFDFSALVRVATTTFLHQFTQFSGWWSALWDSFSRLLFNTYNPLSYRLGIELPNAYVLLLIVAASFLWLVGNSLLLRLNGNHHITLDQDQHSRSKS